MHRWLGIALGLWFALVGLTGALLVWRDEVDAWLNPQLFGPHPAGAAAAGPLDAGRVAGLARDTHRLGRIERIRPPAQAGDVWRLQLRASPSRVESGRIEAFIDPASGALLGVRSLEALSLAPPHAMRTLYEFHRNILLGEPGSNFVGIAGCLLLTSAVTGAVVAWPRSRARWRRLLAVSWRANTTRVLFDLHRSAGALIVLVLLLTTLTGATLVWVNYVRDIVGRLSRVDPIPVLPFRTASEHEEPLTLAALAARAQAVFPRHRVAEIRLSERGLTGVLFQLRAEGDVHALGDTIAWLHPVSGELLAERSSRTRSAGEAFMHWLLPLHVGSAFGTTGLVLMCAAGLAPMLLVGTGLWVWWRKRPGERLARERAAARQRRPPAAAAGPELPP
ncbi:MAG: PepSY domain-containing protein [Rubrivivax sp.]|nr:PepSY domain-containing protein [Rubrivivax sp.]